MNDNDPPDYRHESCEYHCTECGRCDWEHCNPPGNTRLVPMTEIDHGHSISVYCPDCLPLVEQPNAIPAPWIADAFPEGVDLLEPSHIGHPSEGYNPGPELAVTYDGVTLTVQRTHLHPERADYYWQILTEGTLVPLVDGMMQEDDVTLPLQTVAARLAWYWYTGSGNGTVRTLHRILNPSVLRIYPATTRKPDAAVCEALHILHNEALS